MIYELLKRMLSQDNYGDKADFQNKMDVFFAFDRISEEKYKELTEELNSKK